MPWAVTCFGLSCPRSEDLPSPLLLAFSCLLSRNANMLWACPGHTTWNLQAISPRGEVELISGILLSPTLILFFLYIAHLSCHAHTRTYWHDIHVIFMINTCYTPLCHVYLKPCFIYVQGHNPPCSLYCHANLEFHEWHVHMHICHVHFRALKLPCL